MQQICICARGGQAGTERGFEHIAGAAGILADHDLGLVILPIVPAEIPADPEGVINGQVLVRLSAKSVSSEILPHFVSFFLRYDFFTITVQPALFCFGKHRHIEGCMHISCHSV